MREAGRMERKAAADAAEYFCEENCRGAVDVAALK